MDEPLVLDRRTLLHLPSGLDLRPLAAGPSYWDHRDERAELGDGRLLSVFEYDTTWAWWERHPVGDELVLVLDGQVELHLDDGDRRAMTLATGQAAIVLAGTWHRAVLAGPCRLLFVTPTPVRTEHRDAVQI